MTGVYFLSSAVVLTLAVAGVYSLAQEPFAPTRHLIRQWIRRSLKLAGVLVVIVTVVFFLSRV